MHIGLVYEFRILRISGIIYLYDQYPFSLMRDLFPLHRKQAETKLSRQLIPENISNWKSNSIIRLIVVSTFPLHSF